MRQIVMLGEVISGLSGFDSEDTIYAAEPWTGQSAAMVARETGASGLPSEVSEIGMKYFLEISIAQEVVVERLASLDDKPTPSAVCQRVIEYAINDA